MATPVTWFRSWHRLSFIANKAGAGKHLASPTKPREHKACGAFALMAPASWGWRGGVYFLGKLRNLLS